jgi:hypothetical protein
LCGEGGVERNAQYGPEQIHRLRSGSARTQFSELTVHVRGPHVRDDLVHPHQSAGQLVFDENIPCTTSALIMFSPKPTQPTMSTIKGSSISSTLIKRSIDWSRIESASARRKTPLKNAPMNRRTPEDIHPARPRSF